MQVRDELEERLRHIEAVTGAHLAHLGTEELLTVLLDTVREILDVDTAAVLLLDASERFLLATAARGIDEEVQQGVRIPLGKGFAGRIAAERRPVILTEVTSSSVHNPLLLERGICSLLGVPLLAEGAVLGVLHVGSLVPRQFTEDDTALLQLVADRIALATRARMSAADRAAALALQRSLLPAGLPAVAGLEFAARYVPGDGDMGGDWYDVFVLPSGWLCIIIGDVAGNGLAAATAMGRLRTVMRAYAVDLGDPATLLAKVDEYLCHFDSLPLSTALCMMVDPTRRRALVSTAGHPMPVVARSDGHVEYLDIPPDLPLGVDAEVARRTTAVVLVPGSTLCFYTDGLIERRNADLDAGFALLREAMAAGPAEAVCAMVMSRLIGRSPAADDVAILVATLERDDPAPV